MKSKLMMVMVCLVSLVSCQTKTMRENEQLKMQNDSLCQAALVYQQEMNHYLTTLNQISSDMVLITNTNGYLSRQVGQNEEIMDPAETINSQITTISKIIADNKAKLADLNQQLHASNGDVQQLELAVSRFSAELELKERTILSLQEELQEKNTEINSQRQTIHTIKEELAEKVEEDKVQDALIIEQDKALNRVYFAIGSTKELRDQKILTSGGLFASDKVLTEDFNKDYFISSDRRMLIDLPLYVKRAKIKTSHPKDSYRLDKENGLLVLHITDINRFWLKSKYLVICSK